MSTYEIRELPAPAGSASEPSIAFLGDPNTGIYSPGADQLAVATNGTGRLFVDASGNVGVNTSSPNAALTVNGVGAAMRYRTGAAADGRFEFAYNTTDVGYIGIPDSTTFSVWARSGNALQFGASNVERMRITAAGLVGIGVTAPNRKLEVSNAGADNFIRVNTTGATKSGIEFASGGTVYSQLYFNNVAPYDLSLLQQYSTGSLILGTNSTERARIDSSGRLLVGTSTSVENVAGVLQVNGGGATINTFVANSASYRLYFVKSRSGTFNGKAIVQSGDDLGRISFNGDDGVDYSSEAASIACQVDGTPGSDDMPGRLVFSTTADGASSPSERMRITSAGVLQIADAGNITVGTTTGTKIGTATTQKIGFYNATPVVQPTAVADATDAASVITQLNALLAKLRTLGIIAT